jgi:hypothetical protein
MVYDAATGTVVMFRGPPFNQTWNWNGSNWTQLHPNNSPPGGGSMAYDPATGTIILFWGSCQGAGATATWSWDGTDWSQFFPASSPSPRVATGLAFDANGNGVLFGGYNCDPGPDSGSFAFGPKPDVVRLVGAAGGTVVTKNTLSAAHPIKTSVSVGQTAAGGMVSIAQIRPTKKAPHGYAFLNAEDFIAAPRGHPNAPLTLRFTLDSSLISGAKVAVFRTQRARPKEVGACTSVAPISPDPCVSDESTTPSGALKVTVLTSSAGTWNFALHRPDTAIKLKPDSSYVGFDTYSTTAVHQVRVVNAQRRTSVTFDIAVRNRRNAVDSFKLKAPGGATNFAVKYLAGLRGTTNITGAVEAGRYILSDVPAGGTKYVRMQITVKGTAKIGSTFGRPVTATSVHASAAKDVVKGVLNVVG